MGQSLLNELNGVIPCHEPTAYKLLCTEGLQIQGVRAPLLTRHPHGLGQPGCPAQLQPHAHAHAPVHDLEDNLFSQKYCAQMVTCGDSLNFGGFCSLNKQTQGTHNRRL